MILDIHSHNPQNPSEALRNVRWNLEKLPVDGNPISLGMHPWDTEKPFSAERFLADLHSCPNVRAIGEIGLDPLRGASMERQEEIFTAQARIASRENLPVIIHNVRSLHHILRLHKTLRPSVPWAIHGFRGNTEQMRQLHSRGIYTSLGSLPRWLTPTTVGIDTSLLLVETDERTTLDPSLAPLILLARENATRFLCSRG